MIVFTAIFRILVGVIFGAGASLAASPLFASFSDGTGVWGLIILVFISALLGFSAPTVRRAFGRGFLVLGACVFLLPLSTMVLSGAAFSEVMANTDESSKAAAAIGTGLAGGLVTGFAGLVGFVMGSLLLLIGLILSLGGKREIILVDTQTKKRVGGQYERKEPRLR